MELEIVKSVKWNEQVEMKRDRQGEERMTYWDMNSNRDERDMRWEMEAERHG